MYKGLDPSICTYTIAIVLDHALNVPNINNICLFGEYGPTNAK